MSALEAARMGDQIGHTSAWAGLIAGALIGLAIGAAILFTVVTGGAGAVLIGAAIAGGVALGAGGALAGMEIGKMFSGSSCGGIKTGSPNTFIESKQAARAGMDLISHGNGKVAQGSSTVFVNGAPLGRRTEKCSCGGVQSQTCAHTFIGGDTLTLVPVEDEVPRWLVTTLKWTAMIAGGVALVLTGVGAGVMVAGLGLVGSIAGGFAGKYLGKAIGGIWGERAARVGEILGEFGGSLLGGIGAAKLGEAMGLIEAPTAKTPTEEEVANAKVWAEDKLANAEWKPSHPEYSPEQVRAAQTELKALNAENYAKVQAGELEHPNCNPAELKAAIEGVDGQRVPLTYKENPAMLKEFQKDLGNVFESEGITDATVVQIGSGTQGWKGNPVKYLDYQAKVAAGEETRPWSDYGAWKPSSDTDFAVFSDQALVKAQQVDAPVNGEYGVFKNGAPPGREAEFPNGKPGMIDSSLGQKLDALAMKWNQKVYGDPNPPSGGFDFKINIKTDPFTTPPTVYRGPAVGGAAAPPAPSGAGPAGAGGAGVVSGGDDHDP